MLEASGVRFSDLSWTFKKSHLLLIKQLKQVTKSVSDKATKSVSYGMPSAPRTTDLLMFKAAFFKDVTGIHVK